MDMLLPAVNNYYTQFTWQGAVHIADASFLFWLTLKLIFVFILPCCSYFCIFVPLITSLFLLQPHFTLF